MLFAAVVLTTLLAIACGPRVMAKLFAAVVLTALLAIACFTTAYIVATSRSEAHPAAKTNTMLVGGLIGLSFDLVTVVIGPELGFDLTGKNGPRGWDY